MKHLKSRILLLISGSMLVFIGSMVLLNPLPFFAGNGVTLSSEPNLLSEIRAPGGLLMGTGLMVLLGAFRAGLRIPALALSTLVYGAYGSSRIFSLIVDGFPGSSLLGAAAIEMMFAGLCFITWMNLRPVGIVSANQGETPY